MSERPVGGRQGRLGLGHEHAVEDQHGHGRTLSPPSRRRAADLRPIGGDQPARSAMLALTARSIPAAL